MRGCYGNVRRLVRVARDRGGVVDLVRLLILFFALLPVASFGVIPVVTGYRYETGGTVYTDPVVACKAWASARGWTFIEWWGNSCRFNVASYGLITAPYCPPNSSVSGSQCVCSSGYSELDGQCALNNCASSGTVDGSSSDMYQIPGSSPPSVLCYGGCGWKSSSTVASGCLNGKCYVNGPLVSTGQLCSTSVTPATETPSEDKQCVDKGMCPGTVNGTKVCVQCSTKTQTTTESASSSASQTQSGTTTTTGSNTQTTKQTTCTDGSCTTTTTTTKTNSDGSSSQETTSATKPQSSFCAENPDATVCKGEESGKWGGSCGGFTCSGDAVQCAQAQAAWQTKCSLDVDPSSPAVQAGVAGVSGGDRPAGHPASHADTVSFQLSELLDSSPLFGSSNDCPADKTFSAAGRIFTIPFSSACDYLRLIGAGFLASCYLFAAFIVFRS